MKTRNFYQLTGASMLALGMTLAPISSGLVLAQEGTSTMESPGSATDETETPGRNFEEAEDSLERAGQETVEGVEAAGEAAQQNIDQAAQEASQAAQDASQAAQQASQEAVQEAQAAAERAEVAAENAVAQVQEGFDWGWLGLLGLIGLFGLAGGNKRRVEVDEHPRHTATTTPDYR